MTSEVKEESSITFDEIVSGISRWAKIIVNLTDDILSTSPSKKEDNK